MRKIALLFGILFGGITSLPVMALLFLGEQFAALPFVPFDLFDWLARVLPGDVVTFGIDSVVGFVRLLNAESTDTTAKLIEQLLALGLFALGGMVLGLVIAWAAAYSQRLSWQIGAVTGFMVFLLIAVVEFDLGLSGSPVLDLTWLALVFSGWGAVLGRSLNLAGFRESSVFTPAEPRIDRRTALLKIAGGSVAVALGAWGVGSLLEGQRESSGAGQPLSNVSTPEAAPDPTAAPVAAEQGTSEASPTSLPEATQAATTRDRIEPAPGTRPELTPNEDFYRIDINTRPVVIEGDSWVLEVEGLFDNPRPLTLEDVMAFSAVTQPITLSCISNEIGGDLISTSNWTGVRLRDLLNDLGLRSEAQELYIEAADGFYESVAMEDMMDPRTLLVYGMNGKTLPVEHGFPLRIYIPNRYGMKQPKWIIRIEAIDEQGPGYWVDRGWNAEARPHIISIIDTIAENQAADGIIPIGGIAWAGDRGIQKVEIRVDDEVWDEAVLRVPPLSPLTWVQWRYDWAGMPGEHTFTVRAIDGTGAVQVGQEQSVHPDGATGYHSVTANISDEALDGAS